MGHCFKVNVGRNSTESCKYILPFPSKDLFSYLENESGSLPSHSLQWKPSSWGKHVSEVNSSINIILTLQLTCWEATSPSWPGTSCCWSGEWGCLCPWCWWWWLVCDINWLIHTSLGPLQWVLGVWARAFSRVLHTKQHCIVEAERVKQRQCWDVTQCDDQPGSSDNQDDREACVMSSDIRIDKTIISLDYTDQDWFLSILVSVLLLMISLVLFLRASTMSFLYFGEKVSL